MKALVALLLSCAAAGCVVNPDADKAFRNERRRNDSVAAAARGVQPIAPDTGQYAMPTAPVAPVPSHMPVVNPASPAGGVEEKVQ